MNFRRIAILSTLAALPASCANVPLGGDGPPARSSQPANRAADGSWSTTDPNSEAVLYARDGSPVRRTSSGSSLTTGKEAPPPRTVAESNGSRPYLLELYQQAVSEKDQLTLEMTGMQQELARSDEKYLELERELERLKLQYAELEEERDEIQKQNFELAGRLTTAQIRRLESEKMLLETIIEQRRREREEAEQAAAQNDEPRGFLNPDTGTVRENGGQR